jgi:hypothetical protein
VGGIQIEVTPSPPRSLPDTVPSSGSNYPDGTIQILIKDLSADYIYFKIKKTTQMGRIMNAACVRQGCNISSVRFLYQGTLIGPTDTPETLGIQRKLIVGGLDPLWQMAMAAGGRIRQHVAKDEQGNKWQPKNITVFSVQILNSAVYQAVTGTVPPTEPISAKEYADEGLPFYAMYEEPKGIQGEVVGVSSVQRLDGVPDPWMFRRRSTLVPAPLVSSTPKARCGSSALLPTFSGSWIEST